MKKPTFGKWALMIFLVLGLVPGRSLWASPRAASGNEAESAFVASISAEASALIRDRALTGVAIGYVTGAKSGILCFGTTAVAPSRAVDRRTFFAMGSITKVFTCLLAGEQLARDGLTFDTLVTDLLPEGVATPSLAKHAVTCLHLALHNSGLPRMPTNLEPVDQLQPYAGYDASHLYEFLATHTLVLPPGKRYQYSNLGSGLLGHLIAIRRNQKYFPLLRETILEPLAMRETFVVVPESLRSRLAQGFYHDDKEGLSPVPLWNFDVLAGCGALITTPEDLLRFLQANVFPEKSPLGALLTASHRIRFDCGENDLKMCLGWHCFDREGMKFVWHNGGTFGFSSFLGFSPEKRFGFFILANSWSLDGKIDHLAFGKLLPLLLKVAP